MDDDENFFDDEFLDDDKNDLNRKSVNKKKNEPKDEFGGSDEWNFDDSNNKDNAWDDDNNKNNKGTRDSIPENIHKQTHNNDQIDESLDIEDDTYKGHKNKNSDTIKESGDWQFDDNNRERSRSNKKSDKIHDDSDWNFDDSGKHNYGDDFQNNNYDNQRASS